MQGRRSLLEPGQEPPVYEIPGFRRPNAKSARIDLPSLFETEELGDIADRRAEFFVPKYDAEASMQGHENQNPAGYVPIATFQESVQAAVALAVQQALAAALPIQQLHGSRGNQQNAPPPSLPVNSAEVSHLIPYFDPVNTPHLTASNWIKKVDDTAAAYSWTELMVISHALPKLRGTARIWYEGLDDVRHTWAEWKDLILEWFPPVRSAQSLHREMENRVRRKDESIEQYYHEKVAKARMCGLTDKSMIEYLITGLNDDTLITALSMKDFTSPPQLLKCIKQLEERLKFSSKPRTAPDKTEGAGHRSNWRQDTNKVADIVNEKKNSSDGNKSRRKPRINEKGEFLCYNCSEYGHLARDCPKPPRRPRPGPDSKGANNQLGDRNTQTTLHLEINQSDKGNEKYFKDAYVNGVPIRAYVDTGSRCVAIRESVAKDLGLSSEPVPDSCVISGYGEGKIKPVGTTTVKLKVDQATADVPVYIVPDRVQTIPILVGQPFTEEPSITSIKRKNVLRLFHEEHASGDDDECLQTLTIPELPKQTMTLWTKSATVIPANFIGFIDLRTNIESPTMNEIYVEAQARMKPGYEYYIPRGIYSVGPERELTMPVLNVSEHAIHFNSGQCMVRAEPCKAKVIEEIDVPVLHMEPRMVQPIPIEDIQTGPSTTLETKQRLCELLNEFRDCFAENLSELGKTEAAVMKLELTSEQPVMYRPYRLAVTEKQKVRSQLNELLENNIIEPSTSPYASPMLIVKKKTGGERLCIDYRSLNKITKKDAYPLPLIEDQLERLQGNDLFTSLDLRSGYYQIPVHEDSREKTAFITPEGHYQFRTMPFGLCTAPAIFQRMMDKVLGTMRFEFALTYLDDVLLPSKGVEQGMVRLRRVLEVLQKAKLTLNLKKCRFLQENIDYLGFEISKKGIRPGNHKIEAVKNFPEPKNVHEVRRFLGLASYFRRFIKGFAKKVEPLTRLLRKDQTWSWAVEQQEVFDTMKIKLTERPVLGLYSPEAKVELHTDACQVGIGVALMQPDGYGIIHPIAFASRRTTRDEAKYHSSELEALAVVWGLEKYRVYLIGKEFTVVTDCNSLRTAFTKKHLVPRIGRWWLKVQDFQFEVVHRPGTQMAHVDALSRAPWGDAEETEPSDGLQILHLQISTDDWLAAAQFQDAKLRGIKEQLKKTGPYSKEERKVRQEYILKKERVFRRVETGTTGPKLLWAVPDHARWRIVKICHDDIGHLGPEKTIGKIQEHYWFPRLTRYVKRYISSCLECLFHKRPSGKKPGVLHSIDKIGKPFDTIHLDHLGPFVRSTQGNTFLIVAVDGFTKFVILKAVRNSGMAPTRRFLEELVGIFGAPRRIITDQGTSYTGAAFVNLCKEMKITHVTNATATPRGNGQVERVNRMLTPAIASMGEREDEKDWDRRLCQITFGINNTIHQATKKTPFSLLLNYSSRSPSGNFLEDAVAESFDPEVLEKREIALNAIKSNQEKQRRRYNAKRSKAPTFEPGDLVVVERQPAATGAPRKTTGKFKGPYVVTDKLKYDRYVVEDLPETQRTQKFYRNTAPVDKLKRFQIIDNRDVDSDQSDELETTATCQQGEFIVHNRVRAPEVTVPSTSNAVFGQCNAVPAASVTTSELETTVPAVQKKSSPEPEIQYVAKGSVPESGHNEDSGESPPKRTRRTPNPPAYLKDYVL